MHAMIQVVHTVFDVQQGKDMSLWPKKSGSGRSLWRCTGVGGIRVCDAVKGYF